MITAENLSLAPPALVLAIGKRACRCVLDTQALYLRGNPWRVASARFLALNFPQTGEARWGNLRPGRAEKSIEQNRRETCEAILACADELRAGLENALHELRAHEHLVAARQENTADLPLSVILLADLSEPESAAFPLIAAEMQKLLSREADCQAVLMLVTADFAPTPERLSCLHAGLGELRQLIGAETSSFQLYLFDRFKEGLWEVKDGDELETIMGNFLLGLLLGGLSQRFARHLALVEGKTCSSAAASLLVFDPGALIEICSARLAHNLLAYEFSSQSRVDLTAVQRTGDELTGMYGQPGEWLEKLAGMLPFSIREGSPPGLKVHFADLSFENLPVTEWAYAISGYGQHFEQTQWPALKATIQSNGGKLAQAIVGEQADVLETLPQQARLYPGGLAAARQVVESLKRSVGERRQALAPYENLEDMLAQKSSALEAALGTMDKAVSALPQPPRWFRLLPGALRHLAESLFAAFFLRREYAHLLLLREVAIRALENRFALLAEQAARQQVDSLCENLLKGLDECLAALSRLDDEMQGAQKRVEKRLKTKLAAGNLFRLSVVDESVANWAYERCAKPAEWLRMTLLDERDFLTGWQKLDARQIESALLDFARELYQPLWSLTLDDVLARRLDMDARSLWLLLVQGATPLLRPDFDRAGGSAQTFKTQFWLCRDPRNSPFATFLREPLSNWQAVVCDDPYQVIGICVRHGIVLEALDEVFERGRVAFEKLESHQGQTGETS